MMKLANQVINFGLAYMQVLMDGLDDSAGNVWKVPDNGGNASSVLKIKEEVGGKDDRKMGQREASLLRYKEKRQSRLFSKRIRYEVRKLNAEKRPRMKVTFTYPHSSTFSCLDLALPLLFTT